jgi:hypothetical protein
VTVIGFAVHDGTLDFVTGAVASIGGAQSTATGASGQFVVNDAPRGAQTLIVNAPVYERTARNVNVQGPQMDVGYCYLAPTLTPGRGAVTGTVQYGASGVAGATIQGGGAWARSRADGSGRFTLYDVPVGQVQITAYDSASGASGWRMVSTQAGLPAVDIGSITLSTGPPPPPL